MNNIVTFTIVLSTEVKGELLASMPIVTKLNLGWWFLGKVIGFLARGEGVEEDRDREEGRGEEEEGEGDREGVGVGAVKQ